jgi:EpsI family protein
LNFESKPVPIAQIVLDWLPKDTTYAQRAYQAPDGFRLTANVVVMGADRTSIHKPEYCLTGQGMQIEKQESRQIPVAGPHPFSLPVMKMTAHWEATDAKGSRVPRRMLFVYWFVADGQMTADHNERMWWMARDLITQGVLQRWAYVACLVVCEPGQEDAAYARMEEFISAAVPHFQLIGGSTSAGAPNH